MRQIESSSPGRIPRLHRNLSKTSQRYSQLTTALSEETPSRARRKSIIRRVDMLHRVVPHLTAIVGRFVTDVAKDPSLSPAEDALRMMRWLPRVKRLTGVQQDHHSCTTARLQVELHRQACGARFDGFLRHDRTPPDAIEHDSLTIHLNPVRVWARLHTPILLPDTVTPPADALFYAADQQIAATMFELEGQALLNELADYQPCTLGQWSALTRLADRQQLTRFCRELADLGLIRFES